MAKTEDELLHEFVKEEALYIPVGKQEEYREAVRGTMAFQAFVLGIRMDEALKPAFDKLAEGLNHAVKTIADKLTPKKMIEILKAELDQTPRYRLVRRYKIKRAIRKISERI